MRARAASDYLQRTISANPWIPHRPTLPQQLFLSLPWREAFYGGAAGGGKSDALLMGALQHAEEPGYAALILRRSYADLALPGAIMDRADQWLQGTAAKWDETTKTWTFPSGATLSFGYLQYEKDKYRYQGAEFQFIGFDELTQFTETQYRYLFSRLRRLEGADVPLRMRSASNPGNEGHAWVHERFVVLGRAEGRAFVPAKLTDNPYLDQRQYRASLSELDPITQQQLLEGLWVVDTSQNPFDRVWWQNGRNRYEADEPPPVFRRWLSWDTAMVATEKAAYTACVVAEVDLSMRINVREVYRARLTFPELTAAITEQARRWNADGKLYEVIVEDQSSGTSALQTLKATAPRWLQPMLRGWKPQSSKEERAARAAVWCQKDLVRLPYPSQDAPWLPTFEAELYSFPNSQYKDMTDAFSQAVIFLENWLRSGYRPEGSDAPLEPSPQIRPRFQRRYGRSA